MAIFTFTNGQDKPVTLVIEPWAMTEEIPSDGKMEFDVSDDVLDGLEFALNENGEPFIAVVGSLVRFRAQGRDWEFRYPPQS
jgi:hypothetical protein